MNFLDARTVIFTSLVTYSICALVIVMLWSQCRERFAGTFHWTAIFACQTLALMLIGLRGTIPDWVSMVASNTISQLGGLLGLIGLEHFVGKKSRQIHNYLLLALFVGIQSWYSLVQPDLAARTLNISVVFLLISFQCAWLLLWRVEPDLRPMTRPAGIVFGALCLVNLGRVAGLIFASPVNNDFFNSNTFDLFFLLGYQMLSILLTYSLTLMVSMRLIMEVKTQEEKFSKAFQSSPNAILLSGLADGKIFDVNRGFETLSGYSAAEVLGKTSLELNLWPLDEERSAFVKEFSEKGRVIGVEQKFRIKSGEVRTGLLSAECMMINNQKSILSSISDINERKNMEMELKLSRHRMQTTLDNMPFLAWLKDAEGRFEMVNQAFARNLGLPVEQVIGKTVFDLWPQELAERYAADDREVLASGQKRQTEEPVTDAQGATIWHFTCKMPLFGENGQAIGTVGVTQDITDRKKADEASLALSYQKEVSDLRARFISMISHELRTPLAAVINAAFLLKQPAVKDNAETLNRIFQIMDNGLKAIESMLKQVTTIAREESGRLKCQPVAFDVIPWCQTLCQELETLWPGRTIKLHVDSGLGPAYVLDSHLVRQILENLLTNALRYSPKDQLVDLEISENNETLEFLVRDRGIGIPDIDQPYIFQAFHRAQNVETINGTGLGLVIAQKCARLHGGEISFTSQEGEGTTFCLKIPARFPEK